MTRVVGKCVAQTRRKTFVTRPVNIHGVRPNLRNDHHSRNSNSDRIVGSQLCSNAYSLFDWPTRVR